MDVVFVALFLMVPDIKLTDRERFPSCDSCRAAMQFNRAYRLHLQSRQVFEIHRHWELEEIIVETDYLYHCWDWLCAAQGGEGRDETYWLLALKRVQELIGSDAYNAGYMPPNVPFKHFGYVPSP